LGNWYYPAIAVDGLEGHDNGIAYLQIGRRKRNRRPGICADNGCDSMPGGTAAMQQIPFNGVKSNG